MIAASKAGRARAPVPVFAALGDETRMAIVSRLSAGGQFSIARLTAGSAVSRQAVTKHLHVLAHAGLARSVRRGRETPWRLEPDRLSDARRYLDQISKHWDAVLHRLKKAVESKVAK